MSGLSNFRETFQPRRPTRRRSFSPAVEGLDQRALLSAGLSDAMTRHVAEVGHTVAHHVAEARHTVAPHVALVGGQLDFEHNGTVVKFPKFYEDYVGPRLGELNAVSATGLLLRNGNFFFRGVTEGFINPKVRATYVFGVDRSGNLSTGPFPGRPNIRFDATVVIKIVPGQAPTVTVTDLANKTSTILANSALHISGNTIGVVIPKSLLPSTGLAPSQFRYIFWPEDGLPGTTNIASFAPEFHDIQVGETLAL